MNRSNLIVSKEQIEQFCERWKIRELALFGSVLRDDFRPDSDVDILVTFVDESSWGLLAHVQMQQELAALLHRPIDLISRRALEESPNWIRRDAILRSASVIFPMEEASYVSR